MIAVARQGDQLIAQVARSFGVSDSCLPRWLKIADRDDGCSGSNTSAGPAVDGRDLEAENRQRWQTCDQLRLAIVIWIGKAYHRRRRQDTLDRMTPIEYETVTQTAHAA